MKTKLLLFLLTSLAAGAFAQGVVQFRNYVRSTTPSIDAPVYMWFIGGPRLNASNPLWRAALLGGPLTATPANITSGQAGTLQMTYHPTVTTLTWVNFRSGTTPPFADGYVDTGTPARVVPGVNWGGTALVQMVAWQGDYETWQAAWNAWEWGDPNVHIGASNPMTLLLPRNATDFNLTYLWGLNSFVIGVPEPSSFAMAGLGIAAVLFFRSRR